MSQQCPVEATEAEGVQPGSYQVYDTLPSRRSARYIFLQPANKHDDPLACTLHTAHLDAFPHFEAISHVWGTPVKNRSITCNGKVVRITPNLFDALLQVRSTDKPRTLWVDSICINQANPKEQAHQVSLMNHIYKQSNCTLICLGVSDNVHAHIVADLVAEIDHMIQTVYARASFDWTPNGFPFPEEGEPLLLHKGWQSFGVLLQQPWFKRGWVVQETTLSQRAVVLWATTKIDWLKVVQAYIWRIRRGLKVPNIQFRLSDLHLQGFYIRTRREAITLRPKGSLEPLTLLEILDCARWLCVTDPKDRIYAFLSLANPNRPFLKLWPNYTVPYTHVYRDFAIGYLRMSSDLDILHFVQHDDRTLACDFATWIPRWNTSLYNNNTSNLNNYDPSSRCITSQLSPPKIAISLDQTSLDLRGIIIDTVAFAAQRFDKASTTLHDVSSHWDTVSKRPAPSPYSCEPLRAFVTTLRCGVYRGRLKEWQTLESAYMQFLQHGLLQDDVSYESAGVFHKARMEDVHNKRFIVTNREYYGLAPQVVQEGDLCCIVFGTRSPFVLKSNWTLQARRIDLDSQQTVGS